MDVRFSTRPLHEIEGDLIVVGVAEDGPTLRDLDARFDGHLLRLAQQRRFTGKAGSALFTPTLGRMAARELLLVGLGDRSAEALRKAAGKAGREARGLGAREVVLALGSVPMAQLGPVVEMAAAGNYSFDAFKPEADRTPPLQALTLVGQADADPGRLRTAAIRARWQAYTRDLVNLPAADIYPDSLAERARELEQIPGVRVEVLDAEACARAGYVGITNVGQASERPPCLIHVRYRPEGARGHVALVGKGVTFDSGGLSLKPSAGMQTMRCDMGGAATVLGAAGAAAEQGIPLAFDVIVGAVENMVSGRAYKLGDVLRYANGVTVEIHNTDAEGRLVMADCLIRACQEPGVTDVIDVATLTGACVIAVGSDFTALLANDEGLAAELSRAADAAGEGLWRLPLHQGYKPLLKADWGQIKNVGGREAGTITAALFLQHFVENVRWAHLDIAGSSFLDKANGPYAAGATGEMVRTLATWLEERSRR